MPKRCRSCETILELTDEHVCEKSDNPVFDTLVTVHLASEQGVGKAVGKSVKVVHGETENTTVDVLQKLHCTTSVPFPNFTTVTSAVTCLRCLGTVPKPVEPEELNLDEVEG